MTYYIDEILEEAENKSTVKERMEYLKQFSGRKALRELVRLSYDKRLQILLPDSEPPYTPNDAPRGMEDKRIDNEVKRFRIFVKGAGYDHLKQPQRENVFLDILNALYAKEAHYVQLAFRKRLKIKGLSVKQINECLNLNIPIPESKKSKKKEETKEESEND